MRSLVVAVVVLAGVLVGPVPIASAAEPSTQDISYLQTAHEFHLSQIAAGGQARRRGSSLMVQELGARFVTDHTRLDRVVAETSAEFSLELPDTPNAGQREANRRLEQSSGADFDALFISQQLDAHAKAMAAGEREIERGTDPAVKEVAQAAAPVIAAHHAALQDAARETGVPGTVDTGLGGSVAPRTYTPWVLALVALGSVLVVVGLVLRRRSRAAQVAR